MAGMQYTLVQASSDRKNKSSRKRQRTIAKRCSNFLEKAFVYEQRGYKGKTWTSDVLYCVQNLNKKEFSLSDIYSYKDYLAKLHPNNCHIKDKIRQQLQILRDKGIIRFEGNGKYEFGGDYRF